MAEKLGRANIHTVRMQKRTEGEQGRTTIHAFLLDTGRTSAACGLAPDGISNLSATADRGYGTEGFRKDEPFKPRPSNCNKAYACIIARCFGADYMLIA